jgi:hypothetical protein
MWSVTTVDIFLEAVQQDAASRKNTQKRYERRNLIC